MYFYCVIYRITGWRGSSSHKVYKSKQKRQFIESDGEGLPGYTRSKKKGNDVNKCNFIVLYTGELNESDGEGLR